MLLQPKIKYGGKDCIELKQKLTGENKNGKQLDKQVFSIDKDFFFPWKGKLKD